MGQKSSLSQCKLRLQHNVFPVFLQCDYTYDACVMLLVWQTWEQKYPCLGEGLPTHVPWCWGSRDAGLEGS